MRAIILASVTLLALAACSNGPATPIRDFGTVTITPVENNLEIAKELALPPTLQTLPQPTPGGVNRADN
ncbi:DUF3035 domain-containing protein [Loktanella sp. F6476L]|uniref:DUF3035 domain-containing protein n=1 Tax=Loktanella sp. F6476L TaxID=2926405 RepID=UPI001FF6E1A0|nr:DUF3035 domain-containing protein [Loktanella sp. F6476L]MCK0120326.1 DUF3035 domain-containing protein [Loktanella sp. F6476L]